MPDIENRLAEANPHVAWRLRAAERVNAAYGPAPALAVLAVAGSVGAGLADRWSDLEVDCYWREPPTDEDRLQPIRVLGGEIEGFWDYEEPVMEWSEDYQFESLHVTISNFTVATVEAWLDAVIENSDTDEIKHFRLAAIQQSRPLRGASSLASWRERAGDYSDDLVVAVIEAALGPDRLRGWHARDALADRGDTIALHQLASAVALGLFRAALALNRTFESHPLAKWQRHVLARLTIVPGRLDEWLDGLWLPDPMVMLGEAETLIAETIDLAEQQTGKRLSSLRGVLAERRVALEPPTTA